METRYLWIQEELRGPRLKLTKAKGMENATDVATKHVDAALCSWRKNVNLETISMHPTDHGHGKNEWNRSWTCPEPVELIVTLPDSSELLLNILCWFVNRTRKRWWCQSWIVVTKVDTNREVCCQSILVHACHWIGAAWRRGAENTCVFHS